MFFRFILYEKMYPYMLNLFQLMQLHVIKAYRTLYSMFYFIIVVVIIIMIWTNILQNLDRLMES